MQYTQQAAAVTAEVNKAVQGKQQTVNTIWMAMLAENHDGDTGPRPCAD